MKQYGIYSSLGGPLFREKRMDAGLKLSSVSKKARLSPSQLSTIETEKIPVTYEMANRLVEALVSLGVDMSPHKNKRVVSYWDHQESVRAEVE